MNSLIDALRRALVIEILHLVLWICPKNSTWDLAFRLGIRDTVKSLCAEAGNGS